MIRSASPSRTESAHIHPNDHGTKKRVWSLLISCAGDNDDAAELDWAEGTWPEALHYNYY